jgi:large subunit ribosomal protein L13
MDKRTSATRKSDIVVSWRVIDAKDLILGRLATKIVEILLGKNKPYYTKNMFCGDKVVITNASFIRVTGKKEINKIYRRHSGYIGGLKSEVYRDLQKRKPGEVLKLAVQGMLPKNKLRKVLMANLYIYQGEEHPHRGQIKD